MVDSSWRRSGKDSPCVNRKGSWMHELRFRIPTTSTPDVESLGSLRLLVAAIQPSLPPCSQRSPCLFISSLLSFDGHVQQWSWQSWRQLASSQPARNSDNASHDGVNARAQLRPPPRSRRVYQPKEGEHVRIISPDGNVSVHVNS